jgi:hypothetical protein
LNVFLYSEYSICYLDDSLEPTVLRLLFLLFCPIGLTDFQGISPIDFQGIRATGWISVLILLASSAAVHAGSYSLLETPFMWFPGFISLLILSLSC